MRIKDFPREGQPGYRLETFGNGHLSNVELVALAGRFDDMADARDLLDKAGSLPRLAKMTPAELRTLGVTDARSRTLVAAFELARRSRIEEMLPRRVTSPSDAVEFFRQYIGDGDREMMAVMMLSTRLHVIGVEIIYHGTVNASNVRIAEVFRPAVVRNALRIIIAHNHPSGDPTPSSEDVKVTQSIARAGKMIEIELLDHIVIGSGTRWVSIKREYGIE